MIKTSLVALAFGVLLIGSANAACPANGTVTVPFPTGTADVVIYSSSGGATPTCVALAGTDMRVQLGTVAGATLSETTTPSITKDAAGLHLAANGASFGSGFALVVTHVPSGKITTMTANIGQATTAITASTPTP